MVNIKTTDRDLRLLLDLYRHSFLSFYQIALMHFDKCAGPTVYNRLSKLIKGDLIESMRVNLRVIHMSNKDIGVVYCITKKGLNLIKKYHHGGILRDAPIPINLNQLGHDLLLTDVIKVMQKKFIDAKVIDSKLLKLNYNYESQVPDAVVFMQNKKLAIEVELTAKSNMRYREIISNYSTSSDFDGVLYLVKDVAIKNKIGGLITGYPNHYKDSDDTGKFSFCIINKFFEDDEIDFISNLFNYQQQPTRSLSHEL